MRALHKRGLRILPGGDYGFAWAVHGENATDLQYLLQGVEIVGNKRTRESLIRTFVPIETGAALAVNDPEIEAIDINPLVAHTAGNAPLALDALMIVDGHSDQDYHKLEEDLIANYVAQD